SQHLQRETQVALLAGIPLFRAARRPIVRGGEMDVAAAALAPLGHDHLLSVRRDVGDELPGRGVEDLRPRRDLDDPVRPALAVAVFSLAVLAALGLDRAGV